MSFVYFGRIWDFTLDKTQKKPREGAILSKDEVYLII